MSPDRQLSLFKEYGWFDGTRLEGFAQEARDILSKGNEGIQARLDIIEERIARNIGKVQVHVRNVSASRSVTLEQKRDRILQLPKQQDDISITEETR